MPADAPGSCVWKNVIKYVTKGNLLSSLWANFNCLSEIKVTKLYTRQTTYMSIWRSDTISIDIFIFLRNKLTCKAVSGTKQLTTTGWSFNNNVINGFGEITSNHSCCFALDTSPMHCNEGPIRHNEMQWINFNDKNVTRSPIIGLMLQPLNCITKGNSVNCQNFDIIFTPLSNAGFTVTNKNATFFFNI